MSKDKGVKNVKKAPADKALGKGKPPSAYKTESTGGIKSVVKPTASKDNKGS